MARRVEAVRPHTLPCWRRRSVCRRRDGDRLFSDLRRPYVMTPEGGPLKQHSHVVMYMYKEGFRWWNMGFAASVAFVLFLVIAAATGLQVRLQRRANHEAVAERRHRQRSAGSAGPAHRSATALMISAHLWRAARQPWFLRGWFHTATLANYSELFTRLNSGDPSSTAPSLPRITACSLFFTPWRAMLSQSCASHAGTRLLRC